MSGNNLPTPMPSDPHERLQWAMRELVKRDTTLAWVAKDHGMSQVGLRTAFFQPSYRAEQIIADALQMTSEQLFPERYRDGVRIHQVRVRKASMDARKATAKKAVRA